MAGRADRDRAREIDSRTCPADRIVKTRRNTVENLVGGNLENLVGVLLILVVVFIGLQLGTMVVLLAAVRKMGGNLDRMRAMVEQQGTPAIKELREVLGEVKDILRGARAATENLTGVTEAVRDQIRDVNSVIEETTNRARLQISKADEVVTHAIKRMEATSQIVQESILRPIGELSALIRGLSSGLNALFGRKRNPVNEVHQDEEMFI